MNSRLGQENIPSLRRIEEISGLSISIFFLCPFLKVTWEFSKRSSNRKTNSSLFCISFFLFFLFFSFFFSFFFFQQLQNIDGSKRILKDQDSISSLFLLGRIVKLPFHQLTSWAMPIGFFCSLGSKLLNQVPLFLSLLDRKPPGHPFYFCFVFSSHFFFVVFTFFSKLFDGEDQKPWGFLSSAFAA